jgi:hypothetical protein
MERHGDRVCASWKIPLINGETAAWTCDYRLRDRSLIMDVRCAGDRARALEFRTLKGVERPAILRVP